MGWRLETIRVHCSRLGDKSRYSLTSCTVGIKFILLLEMKLVYDKKMPIVNKLSQCNEVDREAREAH